MNASYKRLSILLLSFGCVFLGVGALVPLLFENAADPKALCGLFPALLVAGLPLLLLGLGRLLLSKKIARHCTAPRSVLALLMGAVCACAFYCALTVLLDTYFHTPYELHPLSVSWGIPLTGGCVVALPFLALFYLVKQELPLHPVSVAVDLLQLLLAFWAVFPFGTVIREALSLLALHLGW
ncbi:MAG: hypothetical protein IJZ37_07235 [Clostridia bacterium]|nr:hypothetical protein [Clostridia bacterium]